MALALSKADVLGYLNGLPASFTTPIYGSALQLVARATTALTLVPSTFFAGTNLGSPFAMADVIALLASLTATINLNTDGNTLGLVAQALQLLQLAAPQLFPPPATGPVTGVNGGEGFDIIPPAPGQIKNLGLVIKDSSGNVPTFVFNTSFLAWFNALPTVLPGTAGVPWNNGGTIAVS